MHVRRRARRFRYRSVVIVALLWFLIWAGSGHAAERLVLLEFFTNDACPFCASLTPALERLLADYGGRVSPVFYHVNWPNPSDPFYEVAENSVEGRLLFYELDVIPHLFVDGLQVPAQLRFESDNMDSLRSIIDQRLAVPSALTIDFSTQTRSGVAGFDTTAVTARFTVDGTLPSTDLAWQVAVVEFFVDRFTGVGLGPPIRYGHVLRTTAPEATFQSLTFSGNQASGTIEFVHDPEWQKERIGLVVFVQDTLTLEVLQAATDFPRFDFQMPRQIRHSATSPTVLFDLSLVNRDNVSATYKVFTIIPDTVPVATSLQAQGATFRGDTLLVPLDPGETRDIALTASLFGNRVQGTFLISVRDASRPGVVWSRPTKVLYDFPYLYVDDNGSEAIDTLYTSAFEDARPFIGDGNEVHVGVWETALGQLTEADLQGVGTVFWATGSRFPGLSALDRATLSAFLNRGGSLFLSGQDIGWEMADTTSLFFSEESKRFYNEVLYAEYLDDNADDFELRGVVADPIGNNLVLRITGGDGANNQTSPDLIAPLEPAVAVFEYDTSRVGALRVDTGTYRLVYFAFGFEAISSKQTRNLLMRRLIEWLRSPATLVAADNRPPVTFEVLPNAPNPFNPETRIYFQVPEAGRVRVRVFNLLGQQIGTLADQWYDAGRHSVLFRADALPSGIYLYEVAYERQVRRRKMMLIR